MAANNMPHVLNLSNSIIGVTILAMPYCFKQCGILLGAMLLFFCTWLTLVSCRLLMKAGVTSRRRSYGFLAYYTYGAPGKLAVEIGMIGLQIGTLIAQVVIIGDLGPAIVSKYLGLENTASLRTGLICFLCLCVGLPLGLLKNLNSVSRASTMCILFYGFFTIYVLSLSIPNLISGDWINKVHFWKTDGLFKCLPIFSFAFGCQTQLFIMYDNIPEPSLKIVNNIVHSAVNMCTVAYLLTGFFGYIAFHGKDIGGDIVTEFEVSLVSDILKLGFVVSIAVTFPLIIFPCRGSLYTLLFPQRQKHNEDLEKRPVIPELHFKVLTALIVIGSMITGILVPNVEFVLAMNGATMGTLICYIFPAVFFLRVMTGSSDGKQIAQAVLIFGCLIMILCTLTTLNSQEQGHAVELAQEEPIKKEAPVVTTKEKPLQPPDVLPPIDGDIKDKPPDLRGGKADAPLGKDDAKKDQRVEPPNPREPSEKDKLDGKPDVGDKPGINANVAKDKEVGKDTEQVKKPEVAAQEDQLQQAPVDDEEGGVGQIQKAPVVDKEAGVGVIEGLNEGKQDGKGVEGGDKNKESEGEKDTIKQKEIIVELEKQREQQRELIEEQKEVLAQLKEHEQEHKQIEAEQKHSNVGKHQQERGAKPPSESAKQQAGGGQPMAAGVPQQVGGGQPMAAGVPQQAGGGQPMAAGVPQQVGGGQPMAAGVPQQAGGGQPMVAGVPQQAVAAQPMVAGVPQQAGAAQPIIAGVPQQAGAAQPMVAGVPQQAGAAQPMAAGVPQQVGGGQPIVAGVPQQAGAAQPMVAGVPQQAGGGQPMVAGVPQQAGGGQPMVAGVPQQAGGGQPVVAGVPQQAGAARPMVAGVPQQAGAAQPMVAGIPQQAGGAQPMAAGVPQQAVVPQQDKSMAGEHAANILKELDVGQGGFQQQNVDLKSPDSAQKMVQREFVQQENNQGGVQDEIVDSKDQQVKRKSSKKQRENNKEEIRHRRDVAGDNGESEAEKNVQNVPFQVKPNRKPNEEIRRKKLSFEESQDLDNNEMINQIDTVKDAAFLQRSLQSIIHKTKRG